MTAKVFSLDTQPGIQRDGIEFTAYDFEPEPGLRLRLHLTCRAGLRPSDLELVAPPDGMKVGGSIAWVSGERRVYAVDLTSAAAPAVNCLRVTSMASSLRRGLRALVHSASID